MCETEKKRFSIPAIAAANQAKMMTAKQVKALPWPKTFLKGELLSTMDTYKVGKLLVSRIYKSGRSHDHAPGPNSLRALAAVLPNTSAAKLLRCIQAYECCESLGVKPPFENIKAGHLFRLAGLPQGRRRTLFKRIEKQGWSVTRLREELNLS
jgi:hypothetical protein